MPESRRTTPAGRPDVVVIGGGCAGLAAATALAGRGARVLVLEARPGLGGRASTYTDPATGERVDNGQHILMGCYRETLAFLDRVGARDGLRAESGLAVPQIDRAGLQVDFRLPPIAAPFHLLAGVLAWDALTWRERLSVLRPGLAGELRRAAVHGPDPSTAFETVGAWLARHGQAARLTELLWEPLALAALNQPIDHAAAAPFITVLAEMFGPDPEAATLLLPARPLDALFADPARAHIEAHGGEVRTGAPARVVIDAGGAVAGVRVRDEVIAAPAVVAAVGWFALPALFEAAPPAGMQPVLEAAAATPGSPIVTVNLWLDRPVTDGPIVGLPGRTFQWIFDKAALFGGSAAHLSLVSSGAAAVVDQSKAALVETALSEVRGALPAAARARLVRATAVRERKSTFSLAPGLPGRPGVETVVPGLYLASDWIDTGLPATIESAVAAGHRAALALSK
ncbi:MAG: hydroxysqualene dehydroxylase HpnE [Vicinamibacterales bacterium]